MSAGLRGPVDRLPASTWLGLGLLGLVVFFLGVYAPAWSIVGVYAVYVQYGLAILGGCVATLGFSYYVERSSKRHRPRPPAAAPPGSAPAWSSSFEVYRPPAGRRPRRGR